MDDSRVLGGRRAAAPAGLAVLAAAVLAAALLAGAAPPRADAQSGGALWMAKPKITRVSCLRGCGPRKRARAGATLKISGDGLAAAARVVFHGSKGRSDNAQATVRPGSSRRLNAKVPYGAVTGPVSVVTGAGTKSRATRAIAILPAPPPAPNATLSPSPGSPLLETGTSRTRVFVAARNAVSFSFRIGGGSAAETTVELVRLSDGVVVRSWPQGPVPPGEIRTVRWDGTIGGAGALSGRYSFRLVSQPNGQLARSAQAADGQRDAFDLYEHVFPVPGRHDFGGSGARFGTGRAGHSHQGHDVFARCGSRMVAARGGRVKYSGYHRSAGDYLVIDGAGTGTDYAYMHLAEPSPFKTGDRVYSGQRIGAVGDTGNARGCHLHFELWGAPGWYSGGQPFDPLPSLLAWDSWS